MNIAEISEMSKTERLQTMEVLWDSLINETPEVESPEWHRDVLADRKNKIREGRAEFVSIEALKSMQDK